PRRCEQECRGVSSMTCSLSHSSLPPGLAHENEAVLPLIRLRDRRSNIIAPFFPRCRGGSRLCGAEASMKRTALASCFLVLCCGVLLGASAEPRPASHERAPLLQELVRMTRAGASDVTVLAYAKAHRLELPPEVSDEDLVWLRQRGVSDLVVR